MPQFPHHKPWIIITHVLLRVAERIECIFVSQRKRWEVPAHSELSEGFSSTAGGVGSPSRLAGGRRRRRGLGGQGSPEPLTSPGASAGAHGGGQWGWWGRFGGDRGWAGSHSPAPVDLQPALLLPVIQKEDGKSHTKDEDHGHGAPQEPGHTPWAPLGEGLFWNQEAKAENERVGQRET